MEKSKNQIRNMDRKGLFNANSIFSLFGPDFLDESFCGQLLIDLVYSGVPGCPFCGNPLPEKENHYHRFYENKPLICAGCGKQFRARSNTVLSGMRCKYRSLILLCVLSRLGYDAGGIASVLNVGLDWVRRWGGKLKLWPAERIVVAAPETIVKEFIHSCVLEDPQGETPASELYQAYRNWHKNNITAPAMKQKRFGGILRRLGFRKAKSGTYRYLGIKLTNHLAGNASG